MLIGTICKIIAEKGIGFIKPCDRGGDVFFHSSAVVGEPFERLKEGQAVSFDLDRTPAARDRLSAKVQPCDEKLLGRKAAEEPPPVSHPRARHRKPTWRR